MYHATVLIHIRSMEDGQGNFAGHKDGDNHVSEVPQLQASTKRLTVQAEYNVAILVAQCGRTRLYTSTGWVELKATTRATWK